MTKTTDASTTKSPPESCRSEMNLIPTTAASEHNGHFVSPEEIRLAAYLKWEAAGRPVSDGVKFWSEAEQELQAARESGNGGVPCQKSAAQKTSARKSSARS